MVITHATIVRGALAQISDPDARRIGYDALDLVEGQLADLRSERLSLSAALTELMECIDETEGVVAVDEDDFAPVWKKAEDALSVVSERKPA